MVKKVKGSSLKGQAKVAKSEGQFRIYRGGLVEVLRKTGRDRFGNESAYVRRVSDGARYTVAVKHLRMVRQETVR